MTSNSTRRAAVWDLLIDCRWHTTMEINAVHIGGSEGCRRLRELRKEVHSRRRPGFVTIRKRKSAGDTTQYEYRLVKFNKTPPPVRKIP